MEVLDASDGNSVINLWIDHPHINEKRQIVFSGLIPGGFQGIGGRVVELTVQAKNPGAYTLAVDPSSQVYVNNGDATPDNLISKPLQLSVEQGRDNILNSIPDTTPPESFMPSIVDVGTVGHLEWAVAFATQDKGVGVDFYQIAESHSQISVNDNATLKGLSWEHADSPYVLSDQSLSSYVYIQAVDKNGNIRTIQIFPKYPLMWYERQEGYILMLLIVLVIAYALQHLTKIRRRTYSR
jgi:hypothetical protein